MGMHYRIKGYAEFQVMAALDARRDQQRALARVIAQLYWAEWEG